MDLVHCVSCSRRRRERSRLVNTHYILQVKAPVSVKWLFEDDEARPPRTYVQDTQVFAETQR